MHDPHIGSAADGANDDRRALESLARCRERLVEQLHRRIVGQQEVIDLLLVCLFAGGHGLFVGVPGLAKTLLVQSLAQALDLQFSRIQFTPDLMPADITGSEVLEEDAASGRRSFRFVPGPVFCNLLLADEINRTPPKTQAALLQAMQEARVTAGGHTHPLPLPFHVFATQNPIEQEGTFPLPEAQLDRFMIQIRVGYPDAESEAQIIAMGAEPGPEPSAVLTPAELQRHQALCRRITVPPSVVQQAVAHLRATRPEEPSCPRDARELIQWGAGPRAGQQLIAAAQARAALAGRPAASADDLRALAIPVLEHRLVRSFVAESRGVTSEAIMRMILDAGPR
ncbi:MAG: AAA family ATPase [Myxococcales bacterium]|nr:AAA family ATPase [Myxococcales bacterium]